MAVKTICAFSLLSIALILGACTKEAKVLVSPAENIFSSYEEKVQGRFAVYVEDDAWNQEAGLCGYFSYPIDARSAFGQSLSITLDQILEDWEFVQMPVGTPNLLSNGYTGQIAIEADSLNVFMTTVRGFFIVKVKATVKFNMIVRIDGPIGRVKTATVFSREEAMSGIGGFCEGAATAISLAASKSMKELMERFAEILANSVEFRSLHIFAKPTGEPETVP